MVKPICTKMPFEKTWESAWSYHILIVWLQTEQIKGKVCANLWLVVYFKSVDIHHLSGKNIEEHSGATCQVAE